MLPTLVVPYVIEEPKREVTFTDEMEKAAILCLSEARRIKPKILKKTSEEIEYIVKFHYLLWGIPWKNRCIIVDSLGASSVVVTHNKIPSVLDFTENFKESSFSFSLFKKTLKKHGQTFRRFLSTKEEVMKAVIAEVSVLKSLSNLLNHAKTVNEQSRYDIILFPPKLLMKEAEEKANSLVSKWERLQSEVEALQYALEVLKGETEHHKEKALIEIEQMWRDYEKRIFENKRLVNKRIIKLIKKKEKETERAVKLHEKRVRETSSEEKKIRQKIEKLKHSMREQLKKRKVQRRKYPKKSTTRIDKTIEKHQGKIGDLTKQNRNFSKLKKETLREQEEFLKRIERKYLSAATKEMEKLEIIEQSRNLEISEKRKKIKEIEEALSVIEAQIKQLTEQKTNNMKALEERTLPFQIQETVLIGIPFYLVQYKSPWKKRTDIYPPVTVTTYDGIIKRIRRAISFNLETRIQLLLNPRSPELNQEIFGNLNKSLETSPALREEVSEIANLRSFLKLPNFKEEVIRGMIKLEDESWLNNKEKENILSVYSQ
jgi:hypothetical protein